MRGSEKKVIYVRDTGSKLFEEAYFIVRRGVLEAEDAVSADEMVREASRIVEAGGAGYPATARRARYRRAATVFFCGVGVAMAILGALAWVIAFL